MSNESNIRYGRHCVFKLHVHWVFVAKYRRCVFDAQTIHLLRGVFADVCSDAHATLVEMDGEDAREQSQGCFQSLAAPAALRYPQALLERRALVAQLLSLPPAQEHP